LAVIAFVSAAEAMPPNIALQPNAFPGAQDRWYFAEYFPILAKPYSTGGGCGQHVRRQEQADDPSIRDALAEARQSNTQSNQ
jgi:hypothetical protein